MPADFSALLDSLLVIAGLVLVVTGLVMFIRSKTSTQASSVEAFGIKLNVTHPSLILVLAGVGLMLAPRLLPGLPGGETEEPNPAAVATAPQPEAGSTAPAQSAASSPADLPAPPPTAAAAAPEPAPAAAPAPAPQVAAVPAKRPALAATQATRPVAAARRNPPLPAAAPNKNAAPAAPPPAAVAATATNTTAPAAPAPPARSTLAYAALGLPISRSFWSGETRASYTSRMQGAVQQAGRDVLRMDPRGLDLGQKEFDAWWNESNQRPKSRALCATRPAPAALLSARVETPTTVSTVESAYWPELKLRLYVCATQRIHRQQKSLAPQIDDAWPFSVELNNEIERFLRSHRDDLAAD